MRLLLLTGRRASGKGMFSGVAKGMGIPVFEMSDVIFSWMEEHGIERSNKNVAEFSIKVREEHGRDIVARKLYEELPSGHGLLVISGIRSTEEVDFFRKKASCLVVELRASEKVRFERLKGRKREQDPKTWDEFLEREKKEDILGMAEVLALSDVVMENEGSIEEFEEKVRRFLSFLRQEA